MHFSELHILLARPGNTQHDESRNRRGYSYGGRSSARRGGGNSRGPWVYDPYTGEKRAPRAPGGTGSGGGPRRVPYPDQEPEGRYGNDDDLGPEYRGDAEEPMRGRNGY